MKGPLSIPPESGTGRVDKTRFSSRAHDDETRGPAGSDDLFAENRLTYQRPKLRASRAVTSCPGEALAATNDGQLPPDPRNLCQTPFACLSCFRLDILARDACSTKRGALTWSRILPSHRGHHGTSTVAGLPKGVSRRYEGVDGGQKNPCPRSY